MGKILGLTGPSGVGKGFAKEAIISAGIENFSEPVVVTTRPVRPTDGVDRRAGVLVRDFFKMVEEGQILFPHQPFGSSGDWYGFLENDFNIDNSILTEVHIDNVKPFRNRFGVRLMLIGLKAQEDYLRKGLEQRATETPDQRELRVQSASREILQIDDYYKRGLINRVIEVTSENRDELQTLVLAQVSELLTL